jgi:nicotinate phosphoribosyltransferase
MSGFRLMDFGTRRRFSRDVQYAIVAPQARALVYRHQQLRSCAPPVARQWDQAHEWFQAHQQISPDLATSQRAALAAWLEEYPATRYCPDRLYHHGCLPA